MVRKQRFASGKVSRAWKAKNATDTAEPLGEGELHAATDFDDTFGGLHIAFATNDGWRGTSAGTQILRELALVASAGHVRRAHTGEEEEERSRGDPQMTLGNELASTANGEKTTRLTWRLRHKARDLVCRDFGTPGTRLNLSGSVSLIRVSLAEGWSDG